MLQDKIEWLRLHTEDLVTENAKLKHKIMQMTVTMRDYCADMHSEFTE